MAAIDGTTRRARLRWAGAAALLLLAAVFAAGYPTHSTGPATGDHLIGDVGVGPLSADLRLGTFNIDGGCGTDDRLDLSRTARCLQRLDFIGMEELHGSLLGEPRNQAIELSHLLKLPYLWAPAERQWWHESFGNADFTDRPVLRWQRIVLPSEWNRAKRNYVLTDVLWNGRAVHIMTTHTDWKTGGDEQLRLVIDRFLNLPTPAVLMGDLNHPARDPQLQALMNTPGVEEAVHAILDLQKSGRVDYIFLRGLHAVDAGEVDLGASDHPAYWAAVRLAEAGKKEFTTKTRSHEGKSKR